MNKIFKVAYATGSRADYGIVRNYLDKLKNSDDIDLSILLTGTHLEKEYGYTKKEIESDGHNIDLEVFLDLSNNPEVYLAVSKVIAEFGLYFEKNKLDLLIVLGDRYEMMGVAIAAALNKIPILHLHGGEATFGNYDEFIRHAITKMSIWHIVSTEVYRKRVIQLGENPEKVFNLGALGAENCKHIDLNNVDDALKTFEKKKFFVILFHPETLALASVEEQVNKLLEALSCFQESHFVFLGSNADTGSYMIRKKIKEYVGSNDNATYFENLNPDEYHFMVKNAICLIGNSSSGIIEAPSLGTLTINIGNRQMGREMGNSVINVKCDIDEIREAIKDVIEESECIAIVNPYETEETAEKYYNKTLEILKKNDKSLIKAFWDLQNKVEE